MAEGNAIRGSRIGAGPAGETERGDVAPRTDILYRCARGHEVRRSFAADAAIPDEWDCPNCGLTGTRDGVEPPEPKQAEPFKSHLAYVKERRSDADGKALLEEALQKLRQRRGIPED